MAMPEDQVRGWFESEVKQIGTFVHLESYQVIHPVRGPDTLGLHLYAATQRMAFTTFYWDDNGRKQRQTVESIPGKVYLPRVGEVRGSDQKGIEALQRALQQSDQWLKNFYGAWWEPSGNGRILKAWKVFTVDGLDELVRMFSAHIVAKLVGRKIEIGKNKFVFPGQIEANVDLSDSLLQAAGALLQIPGFVANQVAIQSAQLVAEQILSLIEKKVEQKMRAAQHHLAEAIKSTNGVEVAHNLVAAGWQLRQRSESQKTIVDHELKLAEQYRWFWTQCAKAVSETRRALIEIADQVQAGDLTGIPRVQEYRRYLGEILVFEPFSNSLVNPRFVALATIDKAQPAQIIDRLLEASESLAPFLPSGSAVPTYTRLTQQEEMLAAMPA